MGVIDDLNVLVDFCEVENFWFYIDGVIGVIVMLLDIVWF